MRRAAELVVAFITLLLGIVLGILSALAEVKIVVNIARRGKLGWFDDLGLIVFFFGFVLGTFGLLGGIGLLLKRAWGHVFTYLMAAGLLLGSGFLVLEEIQSGRPIDPVLTCLISYSLVAPIVLLATTQRRGAP